MSAIYTFVDRLVSEPCAHAARPITRIVQSEILKQLMCRGEPGLASSMRANTAFPFLAVECQRQINRGAELTPEERLGLLLGKGYFPAELPPVFVTDTFSRDVTAILDEWKAS